MRSGKLALVLLTGVLSAQVIPDWFILELNEPTVGRARGARRVRESLTAARAAIAARLGARAEVRETTEVVMNALIVRSTAGEIALAAVPGVRKVWPVHELRLELDRAVGLLGVTKAWETVGGADRAGAGMKIAILDSGLDLTHPAFLTDSMTAPQGYPLATNEEIRGLLNGKVIVYRTYDAMQGFAETTVDGSGHGTAVAMSAAGLRVKSPLAEIQGVAPGAWLGIYRVFVGTNGAATSSAAILKALDDAAADGMDVVNMSFGSLPPIRPEFDVIANAVSKAASMGVGVVKSIGNSGPVRFSGSTPSMGVSGLTVGATWSDRGFFSGVRVNGDRSAYGVPANGFEGAATVTAPLKDVAALDGTGLACEDLVQGSLTGSVALIARGECTFESKLKAAEAAGAVGAIVFETSASTRPFVMDVGSAKLAAVMVGARDGLAMRFLMTQGDVSVELAFTNSLPFLFDADGISEISSRGPGVDGGIRPDLLAVGEDVLTAVQRNNPNGELYDPSGYTTAYGTSFASPMVAGAYALVKAARPGLTSAQYRSLLVNTALPFPVADLRPAPVQDGGAGRLDVATALRGRLAAEPVSVSFGTGVQLVNVSRRVRIQNVSSRVGTWKVIVDSADVVKATVEPAEFSLGPGDVIDLQVRFTGEAPVGESQGFLLLTDFDAVEGERPERIPYWYGVRSSKPAAVTVTNAPKTAKAGDKVPLAVLITDAIGTATSFDPPKVTVLEGGGDVIETISADEVYPGYWLIQVRIGAPGERNRFRIEAGPVVREVSILSQ